MAVLDQGVNLAGEQIDTGQQTDCAIALVLVVARKGRMFAGLRRQVRGRRSEGLNAGLLVIGDDRHRIAGLLFRSGRGLFNELDLDLPRFRGELWAWDHGIWSEGILLSCLVGILLFGPRRSHSSIPAGTRVRPSRAAAVKDGPTWGRPKGLSLTAASTAADWCASGLAV